MITDRHILDFITNGHKNFVHHLSIDCVIFGYHGHQLKVLLLKWKESEKWSLPGGFIRLDETLGEAAERVLTERTGLAKLFLQQFHTFGDPQRSQRTAADIEHLSQIWQKKITKDHWLFKRTISIGYYAVTEYSLVQPAPDYFSDECTWFDINTVPQLIFDHNNIITEALKTLRMQLYHQPIGYNLLPSKFTLPEIHDLYETILGKTLDRRNFPKKLLSLGIIKKRRSKEK